MKKSVAILFASLALLSVGVFASADIISFPNPLTGVTTVTGLVSNITTYVMTFIGALAVLMFIWAGIMFILSAWDQSYYQKGKDALFYAVLGLAIVLAASGLIGVIRAVLGAT
jgi:hypothetical protein